MSRLYLKKLVALILLFTWSIIANAYIIDFEEFAEGTSGPLVSGEFHISGWNETCADGAYETCSNIGSVTNDKAFQVLGPTIPNVGGSAGIVIERTDGNEFSVYSLDIYPDFQLYGRTAEGLMVEGGTLGQGDWLNIVSLEMSAYAPDGFVGIMVDNIVVSSVPIPTAAWLFGSALAGLGWMRCKQTA
jgi:hypothetical protein